MKNSSAVTIYNSDLRKTVALTMLFALHESVKYYAKYGTKVFGAFLDSSKAFEVLHNAMLIKLLDKIYQSVKSCFEKIGIIVCAVL